MPGLSLGLMQPALLALTDGWEAPINQPLCQERWRERRGGGTKGTTPASSHPSLFERLLKHRRLLFKVHISTMQMHTHTTHTLSFFYLLHNSRPALHASPWDPGHVHLTIKKDIRRKREGEGLKEEGDEN